MKKVRVVRTLTYTGSPEWVKKSLEQRAVVGDTRGYIDPSIGVIEEALQELEEITEDAELPPA